jgi:hypothetical protein
MSSAHSPFFPAARFLGAAGLLAVLVGCGTDPTAQPGPSAGDHARAEGLPVGAPAPGFTLKDQTGRERTLEDFQKQGMVALVFLRSARY